MILNRKVFFSQSLCQIAVMFIVFSGGVNFPVAMADEIRYDSSGRRDPFVRLTSPTSSVAKQIEQKIDIKIQGIIIDQQAGSMVLVDGEFYKEGETVKNANLISIFPDRAIFSQNDQQKTIWLREEVLDENKPITEETASNTQNTP